MTVQITTCHSSIQELIKPAEREVGSMIDMCKGIAESFVNAESKEEKQALYETLKEELDKIDRRDAGKLLFC